MELYHITRLYQILLWNMDIESELIYYDKFNSGKNLTVKIEFNKEKRYGNFFLLIK